MPHLLVPASRTNTPISPDIEHASSKHSAATSSKAPPRRLSADAERTESPSALETGRSSAAGTRGPGQGAVGSGFFCVTRVRGNPTSGVR